jgi:hypothetical protein
VTNDDFSTSRMIYNFSAAAYSYIGLPSLRTLFLNKRFSIISSTSQLVDLAEVAHLTAKWSCALLFWVLLALSRCTDCVDCQVSAMPFIAWTFVRGLCNCSPRAAGRVREAVLYF